MQRKKGVSPLIATTLLVGFAVAVTTVVMMFGGDLLEDLQMKQGKNLEKTLQCEAMSFKVDNVVGNTIHITNNGQEDIHAFFIRYQGSTADSFESHYRIDVPVGGVGQIIAAPGGGVGTLEKAKVFAKSVAGPKGNVIWGTCGSTETTVTMA